MAKFIFITGGVVSSLGKGITAASIGLLLKRRGLRIRMLKVDPYLNVDPGTMSPFQHGEVFVTEDGAETDLDLGHYERFTGEPTSRHSNITAGQMYWQVLHKERHGDYLGGTVQMIPHVTDEIKAAIRRLDQPDVDLILCELGGTVGDIEGLIFLEAIRQIGQEVGRENAMYVHLTYVPYIHAAGEIKTKPTQQSVAKLREIGILPDVLICRCERPLDDDVRRKIALFCNVPAHAVIEECDVQRTIYEVPLMLSRQGTDELILVHCRLARPPGDLDDWQRMVERIANPDGEIRIGVVGKYSALQDAYKSIYEAIDHAGIAHGVGVRLVKIAAEDLESDAVADHLAGVNGILVPGGFGNRGIEGKIRAVRYARENGIPFFGICLGLQCAVIDTARHVAGLDGADSTEFNPDTPHAVVDLMAAQKTVSDKGGTMRLGAWQCRLEPDSFSARAYGRATVSERHRHRYEVNDAYRERLTRAGMRMAGINPETGLVEIVEVPSHPWFVAVQFHPEFTSQPIAAHPLFGAFAGAALRHARSAVKEPS